MTRSLTQLIFCLTGACQAPSLSVVFEIPDLYAQSDACTLLCQAADASCQREQAASCRLTSDRCLLECTYRTPLCTQACDQQWGQCRDGPAINCAELEASCNGACPSGDLPCEEGCADIATACAPGIGCIELERSCGQACGSSRACLAWCSGYVPRCQETPACATEFRQCEQGCQGCETACRNEGSACQARLDPGLCPALLARCTSGCGEPQALVAGTSLKIFRTPGADTFGCEDLAFGLVPGAVLDASLLQEIAADRGPSPISGVDRLGRKVLLGQGFDAQRAPVVAACAEIDTISGDEEVTLVGEPTTLLVDLSPSKNGPPAGAGRRALSLRATDVLGRALGDAPYRWKVIGPYDDPATTAAREGHADSLGELQIAPTSGGRPGPALLEVRSRWSRSGPYLSRALLLPKVMELPRVLLSGEQVVSGRLGASGELGLAWLGVGPGTTTSTAVQRTLAIATFNAALDRFELNQVPLGVSEGEPSIGVVSLGDNDVLVAVAGSRWFLVQRGHLRIAPTALPACPRPGTPQLVAAGRCSNGDAEGLFWVGCLTGAPQQLVRVTAQDVALEPLGNRPPMVSLGTSSGCLPDQAGTAHRVLLGSGSAPLISKVLIETGSGWKESYLDAPLPMPRFAPEGALPGRLLSLGSGKAHPEVEIWRLETGPGVDTIGLSHERAVETYSEPLSIALGRLDQDDRHDLAVVVAQQQNATTQAYSLQLFRGVEYEGAPISAMSPIGAGSLAPGFWLLDLDGDGVDDLVVMERVLDDVAPTSAGSRALWGTLRVYLMGTTLN